MIRQFIILACFGVVAESIIWEQEVATYQSQKGNKPIRQLFRLEGPNGANSIKTYEEAEELCKKENALIADSWRLRDDVEQKHYWKCAGCAWLKRAGTKTRHYFKNFRPICGDKEDNGEQYYIPCADDPKDEGLDGYDVLCYGVSGPEIPPDSVAINVGVERGYVFVLKEGANLPLEERTNGATACDKRQAKHATGLQVRLAWYNGFSVCACGWMTNFQGMSIRDNIPSCGGQSGVFGCPFGDLIHSYCFIDARATPRGANLVDFSQLPVNAFPGGIEDGATQIDGGYVYFTMSDTGPKTTKTVQAAHRTCSAQGAKVATLEQLKEAGRRGMDICQCAVTWQGEDLKLMFHDTLVMGNGGKDSVNKVCRGNVRRCNREEGGDVFCYKVCPDKCPPGPQWNVPFRSVKVDGGLVFHVDEGVKYQYQSKWYANRACEKKNGQLATRKQLEQAQKHGMTRCRCGYLSDGSVAFPIYRPIEGCGGGFGVFSCPGNYEDITETGPNWDAYCFISNERLKATNKYDKSLMPDKPVPVGRTITKKKEDDEKGLRSRASADGHGVDDGESMVKAHKEAKRKKEAEEKEKARLARIAARKKAEEERRIQKQKAREEKARMHQQVAGR